MKKAFSSLSFRVNGKLVKIENVEDNCPLLYVLRDHLKLTGTKYGCGTGSCGACTVHIDGARQLSCQQRAHSVAGKDITTIEGLVNISEFNELISNWKALNVAQCGYCQPGQIMAAADLLKKEKAPTSEQIRSHMNGNLCRCGTYDRIELAIKKSIRSI